MESKYRYLSKNIILFSISTFGQKLLAFFLIPLYTSFLSTGEYGIIDLINNTINILLPVFTIEIAEGVMRFTFDDKENDEYLNIGIFTILKGTIILVLILSLFSFLPISSAYRKYDIYIIPLFIVNSFYTLLQNYLRGEDHIDLMVFTGLVNTVINLILDIIFIAYLRMGINGYFTATFCGLLVASLLMSLRAKIYKKVSYSQYKRSNKKKELYSYSIPVIFATLGWWANSSLDHYFVTFMLGTSQNGIYAISYKIPTILSVLQSIFNNAMLMSALSNFDRKDKDGFLSKTYIAFYSFMSFGCSVILTLNIPLAKLLYSKDFFVAWKYVPFLLLATLFSALGGYFGSLFTAMKNTRVQAYITGLSAGLNCLLNAILIPRFAVFGAAFATFISYFAAWIVSYVLVRNRITFKSKPFKELITYALLVFQAFLAMNQGHYYFLQIVVFISLSFVNRDSLMYLFRTFKNKYALRRQ